MRIDWLDRRLRALVAEHEVEPEWLVLSADFACSIRARAWKAAHQHQPRRGRRVYPQGARIPRPRPI